MNEGVMPKRTNDAPPLRVVAIGGGHGLGRLLAAIAPLPVSVSAIVATTDNGGSTGRIRSQVGGIAWGDIRNCISQVVPEHGVPALLFEHRFQNSGELSGHNLGNLILLALDQLCVRPLDAINVVRDFLGVRPVLLPMAELPTELVARTRTGEQVRGEVNIAMLNEMPASLWLDPSVEAPMEVTDAIVHADVILLGPGSFFTSIMPPLLVANIAAALRGASAKKVLVANVADETGVASRMELVQQLASVDEAVGVSGFVDVVLWPEHRPIVTAFASKIKVFALRESEGSSFHDRGKLGNAVLQLFATLSRQ